MIAHVSGTMALRTWQHSNSIDCLLLRLFSFKVIFSFLTVKSFSCNRLVLDFWPCIMYATFHLWCLFTSLELIPIMYYIPANTRRSPNVGTLSAHRLLRWPNIVPTLGERLMFAGITCSHNGISGLC